MNNIKLSDIYNRQKRLDNLDLYQNQFVVEHNERLIKI